MSQVMRASVVPANPAGAPSYIGQNPNATATAIPQVTLRAASGFGKLVAMRLLELDDVLPVLIEAAERGGYQGARAGLQSRLTWAVQDSATAWGIKASKAAWRIKGRLVPMLSDLDSEAEMVRAAHAENEADGAPLVASEVRAIVVREIGFEIRKYHHGR